MLDPAFINARNQQTQQFLQQQQVITPKPFLEKAQENIINGYQNAVKYLKQPGNAVSTFVDHAVQPIQVQGVNVPSVGQVGYQVADNVIAPIGKRAMQGIEHFGEDNVMNIASAIATQGRSLLTKGATTLASDLLGQLGSHKKVDYNNSLENVAVGSGISTLTKGMIPEGVTKAFVDHGIQKIYEDYKKRNEVLPSNPPKEGVFGLQF